MRLHARDNCARKWKDSETIVGMGREVCSACDHVNVFAAGESIEACRICGTPIDQKPVKLSQLYPNRTILKGKAGSKIRADAFKAGVVKRNLESRRSRDPGYGSGIGEAGAKSYD